MSEKPEECMRQYANKVVLCESELSNVKKVLENKPLCALQIPCFLLLQWHRALSEKNSQEQLVIIHFLLFIRRLQKISRQARQLLIKASRRPLDSSGSIRHFYFGKKYAPAVVVADTKCARGHIRRQNTRKQYQPLTV